MNREQIKNKIDMFKQHKYYGELTEDDDILLWLMRHVYKLTEGMPEEQETVAPKKKHVPQWAREPAAPIQHVNPGWAVDPAAVRIIEGHRARLVRNREALENILLDAEPDVVDEVNEQPREE